MSFYRLIFYHAMLGGWAAFFGWLVSEAILLRRSGSLGNLQILISTALVGAAIGGGIALVGAIANGRFKGYVLRFVVCLIGGFAGGALGGVIGNFLFSLLPYLIVRALGWMIMGLGIGGIEGIFDFSLKKIRNGLIGGAIGGLLGGLCFPLVASVGNRSGRAIAFVILGSCIGLFIGLAQIILREAWLTVEQGFRPGRQFVLNVPVTVLGTSEKSQLPFIAFGAKGVEPVHVRIFRQKDGRFLLRDNGTRTGTFVNGERVAEELLKNDDLIQLGPNVVRFREMVRHVTDEREVKRKRPPQSATATPLPEATPILTAPAPRSTSPVAAGPPPRPMPAPRPAVPQGVRAGSPAGARGKPCPRCGKPGTPIPGTAGHLCMVCDLRF